MNINNRRKLYNEENSSTFTLEIQSLFFCLTMKHKRQFHTCTHKCTHRSHLKAGRNLQPHQHKLETRSNLQCVAGREEKLPRPCAPPQLERLARCWPQVGSSHDNMTSCPRDRNDTAVSTYFQWYAFAPPVIFSSFKHITLSLTQNRLPSVT